MENSYSEFGANHNETTNNNSIAFSDEDSTTFLDNDSIPFSDYDPRNEDVDSLYPYPRQKNKEPSTDLSHKSDEELVREVKDNGCNDSFLELSRRHRYLFFNVYSRYSSVIAASGDVSEIIEDKDNLLYDAILTFDPEKGAKFNTWFGNTTRYKCLTFIRKNSRRVSYALIEEGSGLDGAVKIDGINHNVEPSTNFYNPLIDNFKNIENKEIINIVEESINSSEDEKIKNLFELRYFSGNKKTPWNKISSEINETKRRCIKMHNKKIKEMRKKI